MAASTPQDVQRHDAVQRSAGMASPRPGNGAFSAAARRRSVLAETFVGTTRPAWSPIVLAGIVRIVEFVLIALTGAGVHLLYIAPTHGYEAAYLIAVPAIGAAAVVMFQALDINHVNAFRHPLMPGFRLAGGWSLVILGMLAVVFFSKLEGVFSRVWLGTWYVLGLAVVLLWRGIRTCVRANDNFGRYLALSVTVCVVLQALLNMSVVLGIAPNKGIPLPFISSGGSSLLSTLLMMGMLLSVSEHAG